MSPRAQLSVVVAILAVGVLLRAFPFVWWPAAHFDSDQAIVGLMAKHISEGRAFPLFFYGQPYMLAVEAYLAAPVMWALGPTVTALKLPLVLINLAIVVLLVRLLVRDAGLPPAGAFIAALPIALPAAGIAARTTEAMGGNVEPWLYVLLLWALRHRPFAFGTVLGLGVLHREFTAYGAAALLGMDALGLAHGEHRRTRAGERLRHWTLIAIAFIAVRVVAGSLQPFANALGPGTHGDDPALASASLDTLVGRLCFAPESWAERTVALATDHLPRLVGGIGAPLQDYGVLTGVYSGQPGLGAWVGLITLGGLLSGAWHWWTHRAGSDRARMPHFAGYLLLVGLISTLVYGYATCSTIRVATMRYNLLGVWMPVAAVTMALQTWRQPVARAGVGAAVALWCLLNTLDVVALTQEYRHHPPADNRQAVARTLEARGVTSARARFRTAYHVTFLARERVRVDAADFSRIHAYAEEFDRSAAPTIADSPCPGGEPLPGGQYLCASSGPGNRDPAAERR
jgi:hypothetical protein